MIAKIRALKVASAAFTVLLFVGAAWAAASISEPPRPSVGEELDESTTTSVTDTSVGDTTTTLDSATTTTFDSTTTTLESVTTTTVDDGTEPEEECNHGQNVSEVARNTPPGPGHGRAVSEAAHQKCPKGDDGEDGDEEAAEADEAGGVSHGHGWGHQKGRGKGHAKHGD